MKTSRQALPNVRMHTRLRLLDNEKHLEKVCCRRVLTTCLRRMQKVSGETAVP